MPLVFVHGVNVRKDHGYSEKINNARDALFKQFALATLVTDSKNVLILNPYWGDEGAKFYWNHASLPSEDVEVFGTEDELLTLLLSAYFDDHLPARGTTLLEAARGSMENAVDLLWAISAEHIAGEQSASRLAGLAVGAIGYAQQNQKPPWLNRVSNDQQFLNELIDAVDNWKPGAALGSEHHAYRLETFGSEKAWKQIQEAALRIYAIPSRITSQALLSAKRMSLHEEASRFLGDIFTYLEKRKSKEELGGPIISRITRDLDQARERINPSDPKLVVVAHSMGGNIVYDILYYFRPDIRVDVLVTVGSQVAVFEELKLFAASDKAMPAKPGDRVSKPANIGCWINIFDRNDVFGFATAGVFKDTKDFAYPTAWGLVKAHGSYFTFPSFHQRLAKRLRNDCP